MTYYETGRPHRELEPLNIVETLSGFITSRNKDIKFLASCVVTNLLRLKHEKEKILEHFTAKEGKHDIKNLLNSQEEFLVKRTLWAISVMPPGDKTSMLQLIWPDLLASFQSKNEQIQGKVAAILANFSYNGLSPPSIPSFPSPFLSSLFFPLSSSLSSLPAYSPFLSPSLSLPPLSPSLPLSPPHLPPHSLLSSLFSSLSSPVSSPLLSPCNVTNHCFEKNRGKSFVFQREEIRHTSSPHPVAFFQ